MAHKEKELINKVLLESSKNGRMFRANSGKAWQGQKLRHGKKELSIPKHIINLIISWLSKFKIKFKNIQILINPRIIHSMPSGTPDCIGWESKTLCMHLEETSYKDKYSIASICTQNDYKCNNCILNKKIAIFKAVECKTGNQKLTPEQKNFKKILEEQGGIYEIKRD